MAVHLPVPFCPAVSRILSIIGRPSSSFLEKIAAVISMRSCRVRLCSTPQIRLPVHRAQDKAVLQQLVGFADQLHVAVFDSVVTIFT